MIEPHDHHIFYEREEARDKAEEAGQAKALEELKWDVIRLLQDSVGKCDTREVAEFLRFQALRYEQEFGLYACDFPESPF